MVGGAALTGGYGSIVGAALGVIMVSMIKQGLILMGIEAYWFRAGIGVVFSSRSSNKYKSYGTSFKINVRIITIKQCNKIVRSS